MTRALCFSRLPRLQFLVCLASVRGVSCAGRFHCGDQIRPEGALGSPGRHQPARPPCTPGRLAVSSVGEMRIVYQIELVDPRGAQSRAFRLEAESWPFPNLPSHGDAVVIDYSGSGLSVEQTGEAGFVIEPGPGRRLNASKVDRVTYRPAGQYAIIHLVADAPTGDPQPQIHALLEAGFREVGS
jgi:hypothetical protein